MGASDAIRASVAHLLTRAYSLPCSTAAQAFAQLVQPTSRFQLALEVLLPVLGSGAVENLPQRILVAYILFSLYAPYPLAINPFKSVLFVTFLQEQNRAINAANEGGMNINEQLVWVLWKILKGDGHDIGPYTPSSLARSPLPPKLRASNLFLDDSVYNTMFEIDDSTYSYFQQQHQKIRPSPTFDPNSGRVGTHGGMSTPSTEQTTSDYSYPSSAQTMENEMMDERVVHGLKLLLAGRERVLTLSEQRQLIPLIANISTSRMVASLDLAPLAALNPQITHLLIVAMISNVTTDVESLYPCIDTLSFLPPTRASLDLMGRLIQDTSPVSLNGYSTIADLIRMEVLGRFIHECIQWLERAEQEQRDGLISDDRFAQGVQNLCRFFNSLIKLSIVDPGSDVDSAEMAYFSLRNARFEEANALYRLLAAGRF
ncbi:hypothetical protein AMATHDRAFT_145710 [Amanita thiersii Skay4041]|uniref:Uncharacterized protein n=1 Tax=Amanita thiersii Skay4041 TaxID=703135 RepID=A0A2A9NPL8_9AGAR|nr:hypothetical protein AMATHDRAFT_145710 [Amanita thiersii Skay4041]